MLGFRGCRLAIVFPEIYDMQSRAVFEAACDVAEKGAAPMPEIMIPFVIAKKELETPEARASMRSPLRCSPSAASRSTISSAP
jgi:pyruvate,orthophosphate dikinase